MTIRLVTIVIIVGKSIAKNIESGNMSHGPYSYLRLGKKGLKRLEGGYQSGFVKPGTKFEKRKAARKARVHHIDEDDDFIPDGNFYKKVWGYWEWS